MKRVISISVVLALSCIIACSAYANIAAITVSPVTRTMTLSEEGTKEVTYTAHNDSADTIHVKVEPRYWHMTKRDKEMPLGSWLEITPMEFDLEPDEEKEVLCRVTAPKDIRGELATMIAFRPSPQGEQAVNVVFSVSLYAVIKGTEEVSCQVDNFQLRNRKGKDGLETKVVLNNTGNIHIKPRITVYIHDIFDKLLQKAVLRFGRPVYPGKLQDYHGGIYGFSLRPGIYKAKIHTESTRILRRFEKTIYFLVGRRGKILFTFFRRPKG